MCVYRRVPPHRECDVRVRACVLACVISYPPETSAAVNWSVSNGEHFSFGSCDFSPSVLLREAGNTFNKMIYFSGPLLMHGLMFIDRLPSALLTVCLGVHRFIKAPNSAL